jgi:hypothetical protein
MSNGVAAVPVGVAVVPGRSVAYVFGYGSRNSVYRVAVHRGVARSSRVSAGPAVDTMALAPGGRYLYIARRAYLGPAEQTWRRPRERAADTLRNNHCLYPSCSASILT